MKIRLTLLAASLLLASPLAANEPQTRSFEHDGVRYTYSITADGDARILSGVVENSGKPFTLKVANGRVRGTVNGKQVSFALRDVEKFKSRTEVAVR